MSNTTCDTCGARIGLNGHCTGCGTYYPERDCSELIEELHPDESDDDD